MHILQTQKINLGVNAVTDQLLTIVQKVSETGLQALAAPRCLQESWKLGCGIPTDRQRKCNPNAGS